MSTFSMFNGPMSSSGPSTKDITGLIDAYTNLKSVLDRHINEKAEENNVHYTKDYVDSVKTELLSSLSGVLSRLNSVELNKANTADLQDLDTRLHNFVGNSELSETLDNYATKSEVNTLVDQYASKQLLNQLQSLVDSNRQTFDEFTNRFNIDQEGVATFNNVFEVTEGIIGTLKCVNYIDITKWQVVSMQFAGTGSTDDATTNGLYVIGKLSDTWSGNNTPTRNIYKSARAFVKYENGHPFDAIIDMVVTKHGESNFTGAITAIVSKQEGEWNNLKFHLVRATDYSGNEAIYLCVSADGLYKDNSNYANWYIHACGINFIPLDDDQVKRVTRVDSCIAYTQGLSANQSSGMAASSLSIKELYIDTIHDATGKVILQTQHIIDELGVDHRHLLIGDKSVESIQLWRRPVLVSENPEEPNSSTGIITDQLATVSDVQNLAGIPVGAKIGWPLFDEVTENGEVVMLRAKDYPDSFVALDGSRIMTADHPDFARVMHKENEAYIDLPIEDCMIIKISADVPDTIAPERVTVLNYNQLITLLKNTSASLKAEIERSTGEDATHNEALGALNTAIDNLTNDLATETQGRTDADTALGNRIDAVSDRIDTEASTREAADTELSNRIDNEAQTRADADTALGGRIDTEAQARADADTELSGRIDITGNSLANEISERTENDRLLSEAISNETGARETADTALGSRIDAKDTRISEEEAMRDLQDRMIHEVIDGKHAPGSIGWSRWKLPYEVDELPATTDDYEVGDRIHVTSTDQKYFVDANHQWSQTGITNPTGQWF